MKIYIAARYSRRDEMRVVAQKLEEMGHIVTSTWLRENNPLDCHMGDDTQEFYRRHANVDLIDIEEGMWNLDMRWRWACRYLSLGRMRTSSITLVRGSSTLRRWKRSELHVLPTDDKERKDLPIVTGVLLYFPLALAEVARVSKLGNDKHNPGQPLHWSRAKSADHLDSAGRHIIDAGLAGDGEGKDGMHLANAIWRLCAQLQLVMEKKNADKKIEYNLTAGGVPLR
jgi:hypothetical protein